LPDGFVFKPKIQIWVLHWKEVVGIFYGHLVHFMIFCCILWTFGIVRGNLVFSPVLVFRTKKNLATLGCSQKKCRHCFFQGDASFPISESKTSEVGNEKRPIDNVFVPPIDEVLNDVSGK
jgi:hypothetical protein